MVCYCYLARTVCTGDEEGRAPSSRAGAVDGADAEVGDAGQRRVVDAAGEQERDLRVHISLFLCWASMEELILSPSDHYSLK